jgi:eukaryotic-like serine/threonine-protein kinase
MPKVFISYRRQDSSEVAKRLHGRLEHQFEPGSVFYDIDSIPPGVDFRNRLSGAVEQSDALLAVIGGSWLNAAYQDGPKQGERRLDDPDDYVRIEIEAALTLGVPVIPVLVDGAAMPTGAALPGGMQELAYRNAAEVRLGPEFNIYIDRLIHSLKDLIKDQQELWDGLQRARDIADKDPEWSLNRARKVLERIAREIYERRVGEPAGTRSLEKIVERLLQDWYLPDKLDLDALLSTAVTGVRAKGVTSSDAEHALTQLVEILKWYTEVERPDGVGQLPAPKRQPPSPRAKVDQSSARRLAIVPKGLRSFDAKDADFFLELLPGPRDKDGLPESIQFWKHRIEAQNELTFTIGLIYGPSGCGKSSLMKAGLLPRLADRIHSVYAEATANGTEARLLRSLRERCPQLPDNLDLTGTIAALRQGQGWDGNQKVLIVLDQFEQWLHAKRQDENTELVKALRQCDGRRVQAVVMVRDDFWLAVSRFLAALEVDLVPDQNIALVDLFDLRHAKKVLTAFGRAFGALPDNLSKDQEEFLAQTVAGLAQDGRVISVRLALFADMVKSKPWTRATLKEVGGTEGVGVTFLEETFSAPSANPRHRLHQKAARAVLKALLPEQGSDIKGNMRSRQELMDSSGYADRPKDFEDLIRILDNEVRLITPTDPEGIDPDAPSPAVQPGHRHYQLTHDYLVPSLREWLTRKQRETRRGRAELRLADRAAQWMEKRESRHLPSLWEFLNIRLLTDNRNWTPHPRRMMSKAGRFHGLRVGIAAAVLIALTIFGVALSRQIEEKRQADYAAALVKRLIAADTAEVPGIIREMHAYRRWADPLLRREDGEAKPGSHQKLHLDLALLPVDESKIAQSRDDLLRVSPDRFAVVRDALLPHRDGVAEPLWNVALDTNRETSPRFQAACALATYAPDDPRWGQINKIVADHLMTLEASALVAWREALRPAKAQLIEPLALIYRDAKRKEQARSFATETLADYSASQPEELFDLLADSADFQFPVIFQSLALRKDDAVRIAQAEIRKQSPERATDDEKDLLAKRQANAGVLLFRLGATESLWPLLKFAPDPRVRSYVINWLSPLGADPQPILERLDSEPDVTIRRALVLSLGQFTDAQLPPARRQPLIEKFVALYENEPDAGMHGAVEWLLRKWGQGTRVQTVVEKLKSDEKQLEARNPGDARQWYVNSHKQTFVILQADQFLMGTLVSGPGPNYQEWQHLRHIGRRFAISTHEFTKGDFKEFWRLHPGILAPHVADFVKAYVKTEDSALVGVNWYVAAQYCNWLSEQQGIPKDQWCYEPNKQGKYAAGMRAKDKFWQLTGYRLPTEAEWEYACRAGTVTSRYYGFTDGLLSQYAWYVPKGGNQTWPVGQLEPNDYGLFDMYGNVIEMCFDVMGLYSHKGDVVEDRPSTQPVEDSDNRALRGGAYSLPADRLRSADRDGVQPGQTDVAIGFRLARTYP